MKKNLLAFIYISLTGLFAGLFFCTCMKLENREYLAELLLCGMKAKPEPFFSNIITLFFTHAKLLAFMLPALFIKALCILPVAIILYRNFALGCCCSLLYVSNAENPFFMSLTSLLPQNIFYVPAYVLFASAVFTFSFKKKNRPLSIKDKDLIHLLIICVFLIIAGAITETICL